MVSQVLLCLFKDWCQLVHLLLEWGIGRKQTANGVDRKAEIVQSFKQVTSCRPQFVEFVVPAGFPLTYFEFAGGCDPVVDDRQHAELLDQLSDVGTHRTVKL